MKLFLTCDAWWESRVDKVLDDLDTNGYREFFLGRTYGAALDQVAVYFICGKDSISLKPRIRFSKREKILFMDILLDLNEFLHIDQQRRSEIIRNRIVRDVPRIVSSYKFKDFDLPAFEGDLRKVFG